MWTRVRKFLVGLRRPRRLNYKMNFRRAYGDLVEHNKILADENVLKYDAPTQSGSVRKSKTR